MLTTSTKQEGQPMKRKHIVRRRDPRFPYWLEVLEYDPAERKPCKGFIYDPGSMLFSSSDRCYAASSVRDWFQDVMDGLDDLRKVA